MAELRIGDRFLVSVKPAFGEPRWRTAEVFAVTGELATVQVRAPGEPDWPYTIDVVSYDGDALKPGDNGLAVVALQSDLDALGFGTEMTGVYDDQTRVTVEEFQKAAGMVPHGFATPRTRERLAEMVRCNRADH